VHGVGYCTSIVQDARSTKYKKNTGLITTIGIQIEFILCLDLLMNFIGDVNLVYKVACW
jgi:hypothetical protein